MNTPNASPWQQGHHHGLQYGATETVNPHPEGSQEATEWREGFDHAIQNVNDRALAFLSMGTAAIQFHRSNPIGWGQIMGHLVQTNGNGMATIFLGAELTHLGRLREFLTDIDLEPRYLMEAASYAARGKDLPERYVGWKLLHEAHEIACAIQEFVKASTEQGGKQQVKVDADGLIGRICYGPAGPPEAPKIIPATTMPQLPPRR